MEKYIGVKVVEAEPMTRKAYNDFRGWGLPADENGDDPGFLKNDGNGHVQWDPEDTFNRDFRKCDAMTFGHAIEALKADKKVARQGWNGKGMWLSYCDPYLNNQFTLIEKDIEGTFAPYIGMKTADNKYVPWLASQTDVLAEDWMIVE